MKKKSAIKLNKFWEFGGKALVTPSGPPGKVYFMKEKYWKKLYEPKDIIRKYYINWTDMAFFNAEEGILEALNAIKSEGYEPIKIYVDKISYEELLRKLLVSVGRLAEPGMKLTEFYGLPVKRSKQLYITFK